MKTLRKQIEDEFYTKGYSGNQSGKSAFEIRQLREAVLKLAKAIDNINEYGRL